MDESDGGGSMRSTSPLVRRGPIAGSGGAKRGKAYAAAATPRPKLPIMISPSSTGAAVASSSHHYQNDVSGDYHQPEVGPMSSF